LNRDSSPAGSIRFIRQFAGGFRFEDPGPLSIQYRSKFAGAQAGIAKDDTVTPDCPALTVNESDRREGRRRAGRFLFPLASAIIAAEGDAILSDDIEPPLGPQ
jgi:hypothetical protein